MAIDGYRNHTHNRHLFTSESMHHSRKETNIRHSSFSRLSDQGPF